ncbi:hypothetical protein D3C87_1946060 [compost metagenome]
MVAGHVIAVCQEQPIAIEVIENTGKLFADVIAGFVTLVGFHIVEMQVRVVCPALFTNEFLKPLFPMLRHTYKSRVGLCQNGDFIC